MFLNNKLSNELNCVDTYIINLVKNCILLTSKHLGKKLINFTNKHNNRMSSVEGIDTPCYKK